MKMSSGDWNMMNFFKIYSQQPVCPTVFLTDRKMLVLWNNAAMWEGNFYQLLRLRGQQRKGIGCEGKVQAPCGGVGRANGGISTEGQSTEELLRITTCRQGAAACCLISGMGEDRTVSCKGKLKSTETWLQMPVALYTAKSSPCGLQRNQRAHLASACQEVSSISQKKNSPHPPKKKQKKPPMIMIIKACSLHLAYVITTSFFLLSEQSALNSLEVEVTYNPLHLKSNLYKHLKSILYRPLHRQQAQHRDQRPERHQSKQV